MFDSCDAEIYNKLSYWVMLTWVPHHAQLLHLDLHPLHAGGAPDDEVVVLVAGRHKLVKEGPGQLLGPFRSGVQVENGVVDVWRPNETGGIESGWSAVIKMQAWRISLGR